MITRLIAAGHWRDGDLPIVVIFDAGYDPMRLAHQLADLPVQIWAGGAPTGCCTSRCRRASLAPWPPAAARPEFALADPATWPDPAVTTTTATTRYGTAAAQAWDRLHPRLTHRSAWLADDGPLPVIEAP